MRKHVLSVKMGSLEPQGIELVVLVSVEEDSGVWEGLVSVEEDSGVCEGLVYTADPSDRAEVFEGQWGP
jgi:hypothetical protein